MITLSDLAKEKMTTILNDEGESFLRFGLQGGGCNGFTYYFAVDKKKEDDDFEVEISDKHTLLVDSMSAMYLEGASIDYKKDLMGESFVFNNPNSTTRCGCGSSVGF